MPVYAQSAMRPLNQAFQTTYNTKQGVGKSSCVVRTQAETVRVRPRVFTCDRCDRAASNAMSSLSLHVVFEQFVGKQCLDR